MSREDIVALQDDEEDPDDDPARFPVLARNWEAVQVFLALGNCWERNPFNGAYIRLDRPSIESTLRLMHIRRRHHAELFHALRVMEKAALEVLNRGE